MRAQAPTLAPRMRIFWGDGGHLLWLGEPGTGGWGLGAEVKYSDDGSLILSPLQAFAQPVCCPCGHLGLYLWPYYHGYQHTTSGWSWGQEDGLGGPEQLAG